MMKKRKASPVKASGVTTAETASIQDKPMLHAMRPSQSSVSATDESPGPRKPLTAFSPQAMPDPVVPKAVATGRLSVAYYAPDAREVYVVGSFNDWDQRATPLQRDLHGCWSVTLPLPVGEYRYRLVVDGDWRDDPAAPDLAMNPFGGVDAVVRIE